MANRRGTGKEVTDFLFLNSKLTEDCDCSHEVKRCLLLKGKLWQPRPYIKKQRHHFADRGPHGQSYGLPSSHVQIWDLDHKEGWVPKNWCFHCGVGEDSWESLGLKRESVNLKGNESWIFIHDAEAEAPIFWSPGTKNRLTGNDPDAGKDWRVKEKRVVE